MTDTSPLYIYAVCLLPPSVLPLGIEGETLWFETEGIGAVVEPHLNLQILQADDQRLLTAVLTHDRVIVELFQHTTLLPMRFGTQMTSPEKLWSYLRDHEENYRSQLLALVGKAEYQMKLYPAGVDPEPFPDGLKGREYFLAKKERLQKQTAAQGDQQAELEALLSAMQQAFPSCQASQSLEGTPRLFILLNRDQALELRQQAELWQARSKHWTITLTEGLPPYHFVA